MPAVRICCTVSAARVELGGRRGGAVPTAATGISLPGLTVGPTSEFSLFFEDARWRSAVHPDRMQKHRRPQRRREPTFADPDYY
jgi:hypothetical protein